MHIDHYPAVLDLATNKLKHTKDLGPVFNAGLTTGANILDGSAEIRASFGVDLIIEKPQFIPLPSFQLGIRVYPMALYRYTQKGITHSTQTIVKKQIKEIIIEKPVIVEKQVVVEKEVIVEKLVEPEPKAQFDSIYVFFEPEKSELDLNAVAKVKKASEILKVNGDVFVMFEALAAPFGSP